MKATVAIWQFEKSVAYPLVAAGPSGRIFMAWNEAGDSGPTLVFERARRTMEQRIAVLRQAGFSLEPQRRANSPKTLGADTGN